MVATYELILGIIGSDDVGDDDGNGIGKPTEYISTDQAIEIQDLLKETGSNEAAFLKYMGAASVDQILAAHYNKAKVALAKKKTATRVPGQEG